MATFLPNILARAIDSLPIVGTLLRKYLDDQQRQQNHTEDEALLALDDGALRAIIGGLKAEIEDLRGQVAEGRRSDEILMRLDDAVHLVERVALTIAADPERDPPVARDDGRLDDIEALATGGPSLAAIKDMVGGLGYVAGPLSSTDNALVRWDGTTGKLVQDSAVSADDAGNVTGAASVDVTTNYLVGTVQVVGARVTGWGAISGTISRSAYATYTAASVSNPPTQAEVQAIADALQAVSRHVGAATTDLTTHGLIGPTP